MPSAARPRWARVTMAGRHHYLGVSQLKAAPAPSPDNRRWPHAASLNPRYQTWATRSCVIDMTLTLIADVLNGDLGQATGRQRFLATQPPHKRRSLPYNLAALNSNALSEPRTANHREATCQSSPCGRRVPPLPGEGMRRWPEITTSCWASTCTATRPMLKPGDVSRGRQQSRAILGSRPRTFEA